MVWASVWPAGNALSDLADLWHTNAPRPSHLPAVVLERCLFACLFSPVGLKYLVLFIAAPKQSNNAYFLFIKTGGEEGKGRESSVHEIAVARGAVGIPNQALRIS